MYLILFLSCLVSCAQYFWHSIAVDAFSRSPTSMSLPGKGEKKNYRI